MLLGKDCARNLEAIIIIFKKQAELINSLYSCGYEGYGNLVWSRLGNLGETQTFLPNLAG
jgi:hypothetical protein